MISGKDLIEMGYKPGKWFKAAIEYANRENLEGERLAAFLEEASPKILEPFAESRPFYTNLIAENELEEKNLAFVRQSMHELLKTPTMVTGALMPDACPAGPIGQIPVGGVAVARNAIHPAMHSADICCSMMLSAVGKANHKEVLDTAQSLTHFGGLENPNHYPLPPLLREKITGNRFLNHPKIIELAQSHFGTQGDGNHFLSVGTSRNTGDTVIVTHHGSRGVGAQLYKIAMQTAERYRKQISPDTKRMNAWIPFDTADGQSYWEALQIVREWTKANHEVLHNAVVEQPGLQLSGRLWNEHNFVFRKGDLFYHAKGATPLAPEFVPDAQTDLRIIPLNMREPILLVKGQSNENNLGFAPHGAGRNRSRSDYVREKSGKNKEEVFRQQTRGLDVRFYSGHIDVSELPGAYKDAASVRAQMEKFGLGRVVDEVMPYGCIMAGDWQHDAPWRIKKKTR